MLWGTLRENRHWRQWDRPRHSSTCSPICLSEFRWGLTCLRHVFCVRQGKRNVRHGTYRHSAGTDQRNSHGRNRGNQCKRCAASYGNAGQCHCTVNPLHADLFSGDAVFMLYNYGAAILRAVGDTKRPLLFLVISGCANALLDLILVIGFHLGVAGVATATITAQMISCILVLLCLYRTDSCYQLRFSKLKIKKVYLLQIFRWEFLPGFKVRLLTFQTRCCSLP